ncbi:MAG: LacI family DNA-binding transcriptional regulator [Lachnospiraceae bacterium]|nr:LacI family DNA-binding transcriptional regulator [Lachnospiraceae bacterium]
MITIREIAKLAGVSPATVSRVMNGTAKVDEEKKQRVEKAIRDTGFKPNKLARALFKQSSGLVGLILPDIQNPFFSELARTIEEEAYDAGLHIVLCSSGNYTAKEKANIRMLEQMKADGIILITNSSYTGEMIGTCSLPVVVVDRHIAGCGEIAYIEADHYKGGSMAAAHLIMKGCRDIVMLRGPQEYASGVMRFKGYQDVCREHGLTEKFINTRYNYQAGLKAAEEMLKKYQVPDGIVAANDMVAISAYKVLRTKGIRVPEDVQIIGFDDIGFSSLVSPEITTIHQPITEMGKRAVEIVLKHAAGEPFEEENIFDVSLIERETTL